MQSINPSRDKKISSNSITIFYKPIKNNSIIFVRCSIIESRKRNIRHIIQKSSKINSLSFRIIYAQHHLSSNRRRKYIRGSYIRCHNIIKRQTKTNIFTSRKRRRIPRFFIRTQRSRNIIKNLITKSFYSTSKFIITFIKNSIISRQRSFTEYRRKLESSTPLNNRSTSRSN